MSQQVWLISSKDIEELIDMDGAKPKLINRENSKRYDVFNSQFNEIGTISLGFFYYDLLLNSSGNNNRLIIKQSKSYKRGDLRIQEEYFNESKIKEELQINGVEEISSFSSCSIWKLNCLPEDQHIFFTRCFPNKENAIKSLNLHDVDVCHYWLASYIESVCNILGKETDIIDEMEFNFLLHDSDINLEGLVGTIWLNEIFRNINYFDNVSQKFKEIRYKEAKIYYYQHTRSSFYYRSVISNGSFFDNCMDPNQKLKEYLDLNRMSENFFDLVKKLEG